MFISAEDKIRFSNDLRFALDEESFLAFVDAPEEWLMECHPNILKYGGSYEHVRRVLDNLQDDLKTIRRSLFDKAALEREHQRQYDPMLMSVYSSDEISQRNAAAVRLSNFQISFPYPVIRSDRFSWTRLPEVSKGLLALQYRHLITAESDFTLSDYNALTEFIRTNWGQIHPDDDPVLGMVNFSTYYCPPLPKIGVVV